MPTIQEIRTQTERKMARSLEGLREEFRKIHDLFIELKETLCKDNVDFKEISMGLSHDYPIAIQEGSTLIRVGTSIFGERKY